MNYDIATEHLKNKWNDYFVTTNFYSRQQYINGIPTKVFKEFLDFLVKNFKQDILFDYLYYKYLEYIEESYTKTNEVKVYLKEKGFEKHLRDLDIYTYVVIDEDYNVRKYTSVDTMRIIG